MQGIVAYGHSWVAGDGASRLMCRFVDVVAHRLGCTQINCGVGGSLSTDTAELLERNPPPGSGLYVVITGLNDVRLRGESPMALEAFTVALQTIFAALHAAKPSGLTVALEQPKLADYSLHAPHNQGSDAIIDTYNRRLGAVARRHPRVVLASATGWDPRTMLAGDTVHPNDAGHAELAGAVIDAVAAARWGRFQPEERKVRGATPTAHLNRPEK